MDADEYQQKINEILLDETYRRMEKDPTKKLEKRVSVILKELEKRGELPTELRKRLSSLCF